MNLEEEKFQILRNDNSAAVRSRREAEAKEAERREAEAHEEEKERELVANGRRWLEKQLGNDDKDIELRWRKRVQDVVRSATVQAQEEMKTPKLKAYLTAR